MSSRTLLRIGPTSLFETRDIIFYGQYFFQIYVDYFVNENFGTESNVRVSFASALTLTVEPA